MALILAIKYHDDLYYNNQYYALVGGIPLGELNDLELEMLKLLRYRLYVNPIHYEQYKTKLNESITPPAQAVPKVIKPTKSRTKPVTEQYCANAPTMASVDAMQFSQ